MHNISNDNMEKTLQLEGDFASAAKLYLEMRFCPVPLSKDTLTPTVDLAEWDHKIINGDHIDRHFTEHQNACLGLLLIGPLVGFQVSSKIGECFLFDIEQKHSAAPSFITEADGETTHYFLLEEGVTIPEELLNEGSHRDVAIKAEGQIMAVPPTSGVTLQSAWFDTVKDLNEITQSFIDDLLIGPVQETPTEASKHPIESGVPSTLAAYGINKLFADVENAPEAEALLDGFIMRGKMTTI
jgi:hypothetical protein